MARGRPAEESAEKRIDPIQKGVKRHRLKRLQEELKKKYGPYPTRRKGIEIQPERPSKKAKELIKQGKPVVFT